MNMIKRLRKFHGKQHERHVARAAARKLTRSLSQDSKSLCYYVMTPTHGNLGDHAIASAGARELHRSGISFRELTLHDIFLLQRFRLLQTMDGHPIVINGGGNIGTLWPGEDRRIREIIDSCPGSRSVVLPSTAFYEDTPEGRECLMQGRQCFCGHPSLRLFARDKSSFFLFQSMGLNAPLVPDLAMLLDKQQPAVERAGCVLCLRADRERSLRDSDTLEIRRIVSGLFGAQVSESDMYLPQTVPPEDRERVLDRKFSEFRRSALVITDRLHGMIFAAVTATPCIVLNSKSPKLRGCYDWLRQLGYVQLADSPSEIPNLYRRLCREEAHYDSDRFSDALQPLRTALASLSKQSHQA